MLAAQLEQAEWIQGRRRNCGTAMRTAWKDGRAECSVALPIVVPNVTASFHMFNLIVPSVSFRDGLFAHLSARGIQAVSHYPPLHLSPKGIEFGGCAGLCPVAERVNELIVRLPFFTNMTASEQDDVLSATS